MASWVESRAGKRSLRRYLSAIHLAWQSAVRAVTCGGHRDPKSALTFVVFHPATAVELSRARAAAMPEPSRMRSLLKRLVLALGAGAAIGFIISLIQRLMPPRLTHAPGNEQQPADAALTSGQEAASSTARREAASAGQEAAVATRKLKARKHSGPGGMFGGGGNQFAAFVSHAKADASMEARYLQTELEKRTRRRVFLDSDDLRDLSQLAAHVLDSDVIIVVQSANVLSRPYCLLELYTAITQGVPVVGVSLASGSAAHSYSFEESARFLTHLDSLLEHNNPGASQLLV